MTAQTFSVGPRPNGTVEMVVVGQWTDEARAAFEAASVDSLVLNYALGFDMPDIEFVRGLAVRQLTIIDRRLQSVDPIYALASTVESLKLEVDPGLAIDLERLPRLTELSAYWGQIKSSFAAAGGLRHLYAGKYTEATLAPLAAAKSLRSVVMKDRPRLRSLDGLGELPDLRQLEIYLASKLTDTAGLRAAPGLKELQLETCRGVSTLDDIATCVDLELLNLSEGASFPTAERLGALTNLQDLLLYGSTRFADGDLSAIAGLPRLRELRMQSRKEYRPTVVEIQNLIATRVR